MALVFALVFFFMDENNSGLVIFVFLNVGLGIMAYGGFVEFWVLILSLIFTILIVFLNIRGGRPIE
ncbi:unnamed protein product [marine sediment metagenome]|uniref:Uncharacterized protein n=1 Tax=marine sediment metagenome TaxID=412755 RepID=X0UGR7_9ZZZZ